MGCAFVKVNITIKGLHNNTIKWWFFGVVDQKVILKDMEGNHNFKGRVW